MTATAVQFIWWIAGTFGVVGLIAFWFIAPTAAQLFVQAVVKVFSILLSSRIGCALLAALVVGLIVDEKRHAYDDAQYAKQTAFFEAAQRRRDDTIAQETREKVWAEIANATAENKAVDDDVKDFSHALPPVPATGNPFLVGGDARRLCNIAGQTVCGPDGHHGMPKARRPSVRSGHHAKVGLPNLIRTGIGADKQGQ
jgi:hypothetical protein